MGLFEDVARINPDVLNLLKNLTMGLLTECGVLDQVTLYKVSDAFDTVKTTSAQKQMLERHERGIKVSLRLHDELVKRGMCKIDKIPLNFDGTNFVQSCALVGDPNSNGQSQFLTSLTALFRPNEKGNNQHPYQQFGQNKINFARATTLFVVDEFGNSVCLTNPHLSKLIGMFGAKLPPLDSRWNSNSTLTSSLQSGAIRFANIKPTEEDQETEQPLRKRSSSAVETSSAADKHTPHHSKSMKRKQLDYLHHQQDEEREKCFPPFYLPKQKCKRSLYNVDVSPIVAPARQTNYSNVSSDGTSVPAHGASGDENKRNTSSKGLTVTVVNPDSTQMITNKFDGQ